MNSHIHLSRLVICLSFVMTVNFIAAQDECDGYEAQMMMFDMHGDGWNGASYIIHDGAGQMVDWGTMEDGSVVLEDVCLSQACLYYITVEGGTHDEEILWSLRTPSSVNIVSGAATAGKVFTMKCYEPCELTYSDYIGVMAHDESTMVCVRVGCMAANADNYDPFANVNDNSCQFSGCIYNWAINFNPTANHDDGSCILPPVCPSDIDHNGVVNTLDLLVFLSDFGSPC
jgi:hypothetical protein